MDDRVPTFLKTFFGREMVEEPVVVQSGDRVSPSFGNRKEAFPFWLILSSLTSLYSARKSTLTFYDSTFWHYIVSLICCKVTFNTPK